MSQAVIQHEKGASFRCNQPISRSESCRDAFFRNNKPTMAQLIQVHKLTSDSPVVALRAGDDAVADLDRGERRPRREDGAASAASLQTILLC